MSRTRLTWNSRLPVERYASEHPATPDEGITHPAGYDDPDATDYENGDTSAWAEDVHPGPYRTSPAPANPMDDGGYRHPAAQPGAPAKNASVMTRQAAEKKAAKCIRLATAMLGKNATSEMIEDQALDFMEFSEGRLAASLRRLEAATQDVNVLLRRMAGEDVEEEEEEEEEDAPKMAFDFFSGEEVDVEEEEEEEEVEDGKSASSNHLAEILTALKSLQSQVNRLSAKEEVVEEEAEEEEAEDEEEAMLASMLAEAAKTPQACADDMVMDDPMDSYVDDDMGVDSVYDDPIDDPMDLSDGGDSFLTDEDDALLSTLYSSESLHFAGEDDSSEGEEEEAPVEKKTAFSRKASTANLSAKLRPQPKKPSIGPKTLGNVRTASTTGDVAELSKLWGSSPDITSVFGK